jgi:hypothetical protein
MCSLLVILDTLPPHLPDSVPFISLVDGMEGNAYGKLRRMTKFFSFQQRAFLPAGVVFTLLASVLLAPSAAEAGCSHYVTTRTDAGRFVSLVTSLNLDLAGQSQSQQLPVPLPKSPCSGAWCSGQPATPAVPAWVFDRVLDSWSWCPSASFLSAARPSFLFFEMTTLLPIHQGCGVFHPPRLLLLLA